MDAEELTQDVFLEFYQSTNGDRKSRPDNPKAYLFGIARNLIAQHYRRKSNKRAVEVPIDIQSLSRISEDTYYKHVRFQELVEQITRIIAELPPKAREAVELRLIHGLNSVEGARRSGCTVDRFYDRFHEGVKRLRDGIVNNRLPH